MHRPPKCLVHHPWGAFNEEGELLMALRFSPPCRYPSLHDDHCSNPLIMKPLTPLLPAGQTRLIGLTRNQLLARLAALPCAPAEGLDFCPMQQVSQELQNHQFELEAQSQELRESRQRLEEARDRYADLYDFAPVGYLTLDLRGCIREINLTGAGMLGRERAQVLGKPLILWLPKAFHEAFFLHLQRVRASIERVVDEMSLRADGGALLPISLASIAIQTSAGAVDACRTVLLDISGVKEKEAELTRSRQLLRRLSAHLEHVREEERKRLAREIHDELGQKLTALRFEVAMLGKSAEPPALSQAVPTLLKTIDDTIESVRAIASDLRPAVLDLGLVAALEWQIQDFRRRTGIDCTFKASDDNLHLENNRATALFRIVQECLTNIVRHAAASKVRLMLNKQGERLHIQVSDNGVGLAADALSKSRSFGIAGMRERVLLLDGTLEISSHRGHGTTLLFSIPLQERSDATNHSVATTAGATIPGSTGETK